MRSFYIIIVGLFFVQSNADAAWLVKSVVNGKATKVISVEKKETSLPEGITIRNLRSIPRYVSEGHGDQAELGGTYREDLYADHALPQVLFQQFADQPQVKPGLTRVQREQSEVRTLVNQGPVANRINLTILGDGYTSAERDRFFEDAMRMTNDLFQGQTFATYLPLFNVHAVFVPSNQSGLTDGRNRRDTVFGLYRSPAGSKRAILPGNTSAMDAAIELAPATDYSIFLANDDFYGGLGGQYAITTRSVESGQIVLRHELGHNFGSVGEEYDGGQVYSGANSSDGPNVPWAHWLTAQSNSPVYETLMLSGEYVWANLSSRSQRATFNFPRGDYKVGMILSSVGWSTVDDVHVFLDGQRVELQGIFTRDRTFFDVVLNGTLTPGSHTLEVRENVHDGDNVLAFAQVYAHPTNLDPASHEIAAYSTFDDFGNKSYRPTFFSCIMRNMRSTSFCSVDIENMWIRFLDRVDIIDEVQVANGSVAVKGPALTGLNTHWFRIDRSGREMELTDFAGQLSWNVPTGYPSGQYRVKVEYSTPEVRRPTSRFSSKKDFRI